MQTPQGGARESPLLQKPGLLQHLGHGAAELPSTYVKS